MKNRQNYQRYLNTLNNNIKINFNVKRNSNQKFARYSGSEFYQNCILNMQKYTFFSKKSNDDKAL